MHFDEELNCYSSSNSLRVRDAELLTAAWWAFQEQQAKADLLKGQLIKLGFTDNGGELMKPPIGEPPNFDLLDDFQKRVEWLEDRLKASDTLSKMRAAVIGSFKTQEFNARTKRKILLLKKAEQVLKGENK